MGIARREEIGSRQLAQSPCFSAFYADLPLRMALDPTEKAQGRSRDQCLWTRSIASCSVSFSISSGAM